MVFSHVHFKSFISAVLDPGEALAPEVHLYQEHSPFAQGLELTYTLALILPVVLFMQFSM